MGNWDNKNRNNNWNKNGNNSWNNKNRGNFSKHDDVQTEPNKPIKSPYNFVPLSGTVVFPDWADKVSHDIPFEDGISGKIELAVTLQSDTYIRNGGNWSEADKKDDNSDYQKFFTAKVNGEDRYIIPGTSFKGMIRNVLEIATFGKMQRFNDDRYSIRDLHNRDYTKRLVNKVKAGWLHKDKNGRWMIYPCSYGRVEQEDLEIIFSRPMGRSDKESVENKYKDLGISANAEVWISPSNTLDKKVNRVARKNDGNLVHAVLVLTGQPSKRQEPDKPGKIPYRKHLEFVFYNKQEQPLDVSEKLKDNFEFINEDSNGFELEAWAFWKNQLKEGKEVPVFYLGDDKEVQSFGLAMMYRLPYDYSVKDAVKPVDKHSSKKPDFSDLIFGYVNGNDALRGRVQFSHFISKRNISAVKTQGLKMTVLGGPKASYYPNYLEQPDNLVSSDQYKLFFDSNAKISGWKRYPAQGIEASYPKPPEKDGKINEDMATELVPLKPGTVFTGSIRFFNLKREELGALIWSLKFGRFDDEGKYFQHNIGMGKPLGLGRITIDITKNIDSETSQEIDLQDCVAKFQRFMENEFENKKEIYTWEKSPQIKELRTMADVRLWKDDLTTSYPSLEKKEFEAAKGNRKKGIVPVKLERYSNVAKEPRDVEIIKPED